MPRVRIRYFAAARERAGCHEQWAELPEGASAADALQWATARHPGLRPLANHLLLAVDGEFASPRTPLSTESVVDLLPPLAGGAPEQIAEVTEAPIDPLRLYRAVARPEAGAVVIFVGTVRDHDGDEAVERLDYEAHPEMAERELRRVLAETEASVEDARLAAVHRIGSLRVGEIAVVLAASAPHRAEAFEAARKGMERLKARVPIWKKQWSTDGEGRWLALSDCVHHEEPKSRPPPNDEGTANPLPRGGQRR